MRANVIPRAVAMHGLRAAPLPPPPTGRLARYLSGRLESPASPRVKATMRGGFSMLLDLGESYERTMYYSGFYTPWLTQIFRQYLICELNTALLDASGIRRSALRDFVG